MRCKAIGVQSGTQCKRHTVKGAEFCRDHLVAMGQIPPTPTLPPDERTKRPQLKDEIAACMKPEKKLPVSRHVDPDDYEAHPENYIVICRNTLTLRCRATSKRSKQRCKAPAVRGKRVCRFHGGKSTGPRTEAGKKGSGFQPVHGRETIVKRKHRSQKGKKLRILKRAIEEHGF
jgi:hypothetical protein